MLWVSEYADKGKDLSLFNIPHPTLGVNIILEELMDLFPRRGDSDNSTTMKVKCGRISMQRDTI